MKIKIGDNSLKLRAGTSTANIDRGPRGYSAYEVAVQEGYIGTEDEWLASLKGDKGDIGPQGERGIQGPRGQQGAQGIQGEPGPSNNLSIGTVTKGEEADATITGESPEQILNLVLPKGDKGDKGDAGSQGPVGPSNTLSIGTVTKGEEADATITGVSPNQTLNLVLPKGDKGDLGAKGDKGDKGDTGSQGPKGDKGDKGDTGSQGPKGDPGTTDYEDTTNKPSINNIELSGNLSLSDLGIDQEFVKDNNYVHTDNNYTTTEKNKLAGLSNYDDTQIQQAITNLGSTKADKTEIPDVSNFITKSVNDLVNYYLKTDTYTKTEVNNLISTIEKATFEVVNQLPTTGVSNVIYLVPSSNPKTQNVKDEYIWINNAWEQIGSTQADLTGYATETWVNTQISGFLTQSQIETLINTAVSDKYTKPNTGIPKTDLATDIQTSLGKADSAVQLEEFELINTINISEAVGIIELGNQNIDFSKYKRIVIEGDLAGDSANTTQPNLMLHKNENISELQSKFMDTNAGARYQLPKTATKRYWSLDISIIDTVWEEYFLAKFKEYGPYSGYQTANSTSSQFFYGTVGYNSVIKQNISFPERLILTSNTPTVWNFGTQTKLKIYGVRK